MINPTFGNEPAFPVVTRTMGFTPGLSKRQWLAAHFLQGIIIGTARADPDPEHPMRYNFEEMFSDGVFAETRIMRRDTDGKDVKMSIGEVWASEAWNLAICFMEEEQRLLAEWGQHQADKEEKAEP